MTNSMFIKYVDITNYICEVIHYLIINSTRPSDIKVKETICY